MHEILQKRIEEAAKKAKTDFLNRFNWSGNQETSFKQGAIWMLGNQWISVEEALPPVRENGTENRSWSDWVIIMTHKGGTFMDCYAFHRKEWLNNGNDVTHWCPIPQLEGGEK